MEVTRKESRLIQVKRADCEVYNILFEMTTSVQPLLPLAYANKKFEARV